MKLGIKKQNEKKENNDKMKRNSIILIIILGVIAFILIVYFAIIALISINTAANNDELYKKYMQNDNYNCTSSVCISNEKTFEENQNYTYVETINFDENSYSFDAKNSSDNSNYVGKYLVSDNTIIITFTIDDITFKGTYDVTNQFISINPICSDCTLDELNNIYSNYRDNAYDVCISLAKASLDVINSEE